MKERDDTPKDALTDGVTDAVRDIAQKREAMAGWEVEYSRKKKRARILVASLAFAACIAFGVFLFLRNPSGSALKEPVLRGGVSYDAALEMIDSLIQAGDITEARERIIETRQAIGTDTIEAFHSVEPKPSKDEIEYSRVLVKDLLSRLDELENKILNTNE